MSSVGKSVYIFFWSCKVPLLNKYLLIGSFLGSFNSPRAILLHVNRKVDYNSPTLTELRNMLPFLVIVNVDTNRYIIIKLRQWRNLQIIINNKLLSLINCLSLTHCFSRNFSLFLFPVTKRRQSLLDNGVYCIVYSLCF